MPRKRYQDPEVFLRKGVRRSVWYGKYHVYVLEDGRERRKGRTVALGNKSSMTKGGAKALLRELIARDTGGPAKPDSRTTFQTFVETVFLPIQRWRKHTRDTNEGILRNHILPALGKCKLDELTLIDCQSWMDEWSKGRSESQVRKACNLIRASLRLAYEEQYIERNPASRLRVTQDVVKPDHTFLTLEQAQELQDHVEADVELSAAVEICLSVGHRRGELIALQWDDLELNMLHIRRSVAGPCKSGSERSVPLGQRSMAIINRLREQNGHSKWMFPSPKNPEKHCDPNAFQQRLKKATRTLGYPCNFKVFRRSAATLAGRHGTPRDLQDMLGHSDPRLTLKVYQQPIAAGVREMVDALDAEFSNRKQKTVQ